MLNILNRTKSFLVQCKRVWSILRKPDSREFKITSKVAAIGLGLIGLIGFIISIFMNLF